MNRAEDISRLSERRRRLDRLEQQVARTHLLKPDADSGRLADVLRYALSFARLTTVRNRDGVDVEVGGLIGLHADRVHDELSRVLAPGAALWGAARALPDLVERTRRVRASLLSHLPLDRDSLEAEVTTRKLAVVSGGGGGAGYVYPGCYAEIERAGLVPDLMVGTSIGALMSLFRARRRRYDAAPMVQAGRALTWSNVFRVLDTESRYGLPATLRLYLRAALGGLFLRSDGSPLTMADMEIPLHVVSTGITVDALKHDLDFYEHLLDDEVRRVRRAGGFLKVLSILREFLSRPEALVEVVIGRTPGTEAFDVLDAAGFSSAIPAVLHYDVLRDDTRMKGVLDTLYAQMGITRLGEGGMVANVPARIAWESLMSGRIGGRRNGFVLALDCLSPTRYAPGWYPLAHAVRVSNVERNLPYADLYLPIVRTLSPMNLVPPVRDYLAAMRWGQAAIQPEMPFVREMMRALPVLPDR